MYLYLAFNEGCDLMIRTKLIKENIITSLYIVNYPHYQEELCKMEIKYLLNSKLIQKHAFSEVFIEPERSPYIKECLRILKECESFEETLVYINSLQLQMNDFKVLFLKVDEDVSYEKRMKCISEVGQCIEGEPKMKDPKIILGISKVEGKWVFGIYEKNNFQWHIHEKKPYNYSNALTMRIAKAILNVAIGNNLEYSIVDPCCGVGTVLIEGLAIGANIKGIELNPLIASNAKKNLEFFGMDSSLIECGNIHKLNDKFDVAIIDLPYGLFTKCTLKEQTDIISSARRICSKLLIVTMEDMSNYIEEAGFEIIEIASVTKGNFMRYITLCK